MLEILLLHLHDIRKTMYFIRLTRPTSSDVTICYLNNPVSPSALMGHSDEVTFYWYNRCIMIHDIRLGLSLNNDLWLIYVRIYIAWRRCMREQDFGTWHDLNRLGRTERRLSLGWDANGIWSRWEETLTNLIMSNDSSSSFNTEVWPDKAYL
jgi:hypothetical protein